jgi:hypothetical protein
VPWCPDCDRFYNPNSLTTVGACPTCGRALGEDAPAKPEKLRKFSDEPAPWHFQVLLACGSVYLGFLLFQGIFWAAHHL